MKRRASLRAVRLVPWAALSLSLGLSLATAVMSTRVRQGHILQSFRDQSLAYVAPLVGVLFVLTSVLLYALTRSQLAARRAVRAGALALERGEVLRARLEQQGRTAQQQAQERLALIDALFRATPAGLAVFDRELRFVRLNQGLSDINGIPAGAHLGRRLRDLLPELDASLEAELRCVITSGESRTIEVAGRTPAQASSRTWLCNCAPVRDGNTDVVGVATVVLDITERKEAERETRRLVEALRAEREVFDVVHHVGQQIAAELNMERLAQALADAAILVSNAQVAAFVYSDGSGDAQWALSGACERSKRFDPRRLLGLLEALPPAGLRSANAGQDSELHDVLANAFGESLREVVSLIVLPIPHARGYRTAAIFVAHREPNRFTDRDQSVLAGLSTQAAIALENARLYGEAEGLIRALAQSNRELDQFAYVASHDLNLTRSSPIWTGQRTIILR